MIDFPNGYAKVFLFEKPAVLERLARWNLLLAEFDITYVTQKSIKIQAMVNHLAEKSVDGYQSMADFLPDEQF